MVIMDATVHGHVVMIGLNYPLINDVTNCDFTPMIDSVCGVAPTWAFTSQEESLEVLTEMIVGNLTIFCSYFSLLHVPADSSLDQQETMILLLHISQSSWKGSRKPCLKSV